MIKENRAVYNYFADMKKNKWSGEVKLKKTDLSLFLKLGFATLN